MSDLDKLRKRIAAYQDDLVQARDRDRTFMQNTPMSEWMSGHEAGLAIALSLLHIWTDGQFGVPRDEQQPRGEQR